MKKLAPVNQKSLYQSAGDLYAMIINEEVAVDRAEQANAALCTMNRAYALEVKRAEIERELKGMAERVEVRIIETKNFDQIPIEENCR
jgi:hypothetical protein